MNGMCVCSSVCTVIIRNNRWSPSNLNIRTNTPIDCGFCCAVTHLMWVAHSLIHRETLNRLSQNKYKIWILTHFTSNFMIFSPFRLGASEWMCICTCECVNMTTLKCLHFINKIIIIERSPICQLNTHTPTHVNRMQMLLIWKRKHKRWERMLKCHVFTRLTEPNHQHLHLS